MKKFSFLLIAVFLAFGSFAQCVIDSNLLVLDSTTGGFYPAANHFPHIVEDSAYSQTVQAKIQANLDESFTAPVVGAISVSIKVDSVRIDSLDGLPYGISWSIYPAVSPGGGYDCVLFSGTTPNGPGNYPITPVGMVWGHISITSLLLNVSNKDTFFYGDLNRLPAYGNFYLVVDSTPQALSAATNARTICTGTTGNASVTAAGGSPIAPYTYLWDNGVTSYTINNVPAGTYYVTVTSGEDTVTDSVALIADPTPIDVSVTSTTNDSSAGQTIGAATIMVSGGTPPYTYRWTNRDSTSTVTNLAPGTYNVFVTDSLGCTSRDSVVIRDLTAGVSTIADIAPQISLFPNPANNQLNVVIESPVATSANIEVIDLTGKVLYSVPANISTARYSQLINVSKFSAGVYILQLTTGTQSIHQRFVVTR